MKYRNISNVVRNLSRQDHTQHIQDIMSNLSQDQRPFWRWLKNFKNKSTRVPGINYCGTTLTSAHDKARAFSELFNSFFVKENPADLIFLKEELSAHKSNDCVEHLTISWDEVHKLLSKIDTSKASGPDGIPGRLLKEGAFQLSEPLTMIFNQSISCGQLPKDWISANVTPVFKKGCKHTISNYRPISLTCLPVKILERLIYNHIEEFLDSQNHLTQSQHGFRKRHSCQTQLL